MQSGDDNSLVDLLNLARDGDEAARDRLFAKCRSYVGLVARTQVERRLQSKVDASDLVQQTLMDAHRGFKNFRGNSEGEWLAWLKRILMHNATDFVRHYRGTEKRQTNREVPLWVGSPSGAGEYFRDPSDPGATPSEIVSQKEREIELAEAVDQLSEDYREIIILRNLQRLSFSEVAERMGRSRPAVQMLWMRAISRLKDSMKS